MDRFEASLSAGVPTLVTPVFADQAGGDDSSGNGRYEIPTRM